MAKKVKAAAPAPENEDTESGKGRLSSVAMAVRLLKCFSADEAELGVSELGKRLGVAKSTAHRLAATLVAEELLERSPTSDKYRLGLGLFGLGALVRHRMTVSTEARPFLFALREQTGETVLLGVRSGREIMHVYHLESPQVVRMRSDIGVRRSARYTAIGRAIFAHLPDGDVAELLAQAEPRSATGVQVGATQYRALLRAAREQGFATENEESEAGVRCIAAPVLDSSGAPVAAVAVAGPTQRLTLAQLTKLATPLKACAREISVRLGHNAPTSF